MVNLVRLKRRAQGQNVVGQKFERADLSTLAAFGSTWEGCTFDSCDLSLANFTANTFTGCRFVDCEMPIVCFTNSKMRHVRFDRCRIKKALLNEIHPLDDVHFVDCEMHESSFYGSTVREAVFVGTNLHGADLRWLECHSATFKDVVLWGASVQFGCQFFSTQNTFDERSVNLFVGMVARLHPNEEKRTLLRDLAGKEMSVVERLMADPEKVEA